MQTISFSLSPHVYSTHKVVMMMIHFQSYMLIIYVITGAPAMARDMIIRNPLLELATTDELTRLAGYGEEKLSTVVVAGTLLCDAFLRKNSPLESHPIPGALVGVSCRHTSVNRKTSKSSNWVLTKGKTDQYGDFHIDLPSHLHAIPNIEKRCFVRILGLPKKSPCHRSALTNYKHKQIELLSSSGNGIRAYSSHGIHLTSHKRHPHPFRGRKTHHAHFVAN